MSLKTLGLVVIIVGLLIIVGSLAAGYIGLSASTAIGIKKILGAVVGLVIGGAGVYLYTRQK